MDPNPNSCPTRTPTLALIFAPMLARKPSLASHLHRNSHRTRHRGVLAEQVDAVTFKSFMESPVSTDGNALTELTNSLQPTSQCMRNITMCGLSAPRR